MAAPRDLHRLLDQRLAAELYVHAEDERQATPASSAVSMRNLPVTDAGVLRTCRAKYL
jgi:hypothetical protein